MKLELQFDIENVKVTEFGVGLDQDNDRSFVAVPVDEKVQQTLREMVQATWDALQNKEEHLTEYEPSEKYSNTECLYLPIDDSMGSFVKNLHEASNLPLNSGVLDVPSAVFCYFARLIDDKERSLTALRRATQFKGVLKARLIQLFSDTLRLVEDRVFKLDTDFDLLANENYIYIVRPSGFEFAGQLQEAILNAVPKNIQAIQSDLSFVDLAPIEEYAKKHPRAARYLASIRSQGFANGVGKSQLKELCERTGVQITEAEGKLIVAPGHEMAFLELIDRRRYELELVNGQPERFKAGSRRRIDNS